MKKRYAKNNPTKIQSRITVSTDQTEKLKIPNIGLTNIRLDIGVDEGDEISFYYDPMIAKIISHGDNRNQAIEYLKNYLSEIEIAGIKTNLDLLIKLVWSQLVFAELRIQFLIEI